MKYWHLSLFFIIALLAVLLPNMAHAAATRVFEDITKPDTVWTIENSPYIMEKPIINVIPGVELTIQDGVEIISNNNDVILTIEGALSTQYLNDTILPIHFGPRITLTFDSMADDGSLIESTQIDGPLNLNRGHIQIINSLLQAPVVINKDAVADIINNHFSLAQSSLSPALQINQTDIKTIQGNTFNVAKDAVVFNQSIATFSSNSVLSGNVGVTIDGGKITVGENMIQGNKTAMDIINNSQVEISRNLIQFSDVGIDLDSTSNARIIRNTITGNGVGIQNYAPDPYIYANDIFNNNLSRSHDENSGLWSGPNIPHLIDAANNWWGDVMGPSVINRPNAKGEKISGNVNYYPWLSGFANYPLKAGDITFNEIFPNPDISPSTNEWKGEWLELSNNLNLPLTIFDLAICDQYYYDTNLFQCKTGKATPIPPMTLTAKGYIIIAGDKDEFVKKFPSLKNNQYVAYVDKIGNNLNNSSESLYLYQNGLLLDKISYEQSKENMSYAKTFKGWFWLNATPLAPNPLPPPPTPKPDNKPTGGSNDPYQHCVKIKLHTVKKYLDRCVIITAKVKNPSGSTFYLTDGRHTIKIYLRSKYRISKPRLYTNDTIRITGVVNIYRGTWRILPRFSKHLRLITRYFKPQSVKSSLIKTLTKKYSSQKNTKSTNRKSNLNISQSNSTPFSSSSGSTQPSILPQDQTGLVKAASTNKSSPTKKSSPARRPLTIAIISAIILLFATIIFPRLKYAKNIH